MGVDRVDSTPKLSVRGDGAGGYVVVTFAIEVWGLRWRPCADCFLTPLYLRVVPDGPRVQL